MSEEVEIILNRLRERGVNTINSIFIDNSSFALSGQGPGRGESDNPYDSPVGAVGVNFNSVGFKVDPDGRITSAEEQTPTLPIMKELGKGFIRGDYRVNICRERCQPEVQSARYAAELFRELQRRMAIPGDGLLELREVPEDVGLIYLHKNTRTLADVIYAMLEFSNNYVANQVYLVFGAEKFGYPATWQKAERALTDTLTDIMGVEIAKMVLLKEGSGLSRKNKITAQAMIETLTAFQPFTHLLPDKKGTYLKSGTLQGVYNYAGYLFDGKPFVIMLNQQKNTREAVLKRLQMFSETMVK